MNARKSLFSSPQYLKENRIIAGDLVNPGDSVILVTPIDSSALKDDLYYPGSDLA